MIKLVSIVRVWNHLEHCLIKLIASEKKVYSRIHKKIFVFANLYSRYESYSSLGVFVPALVLAYVHSQMNPQTWTKVGANRSSRLTASPDLNFYPLTPPPQCPPCVSRGNLFGVYPFPDKSAHLCQIWCQSVQPFGSFSRICAKVSSALSRCACCLAQKHAKKHHLYIKNYNSGPNMTTST